MDGGPGGGRGGRSLTSAAMISGGQHQLYRRSWFDELEKSDHLRGMFYSLLIGFLIFDGVAAVIFWLLVADGMKGADRDIKEIHKARDRAIDDWFRTSEKPSDEHREHPKDHA